MSIKELLQGTFLFLVFVVIFGFIIYGGQSLLNKNKETSLSSISDGVINAQQIYFPGQNIPQRDWRVGQLEVGSSSAICTESDLLASDKILFEKDSAGKFAMASLTKLMSAVIVLDNYNLSQRITLDEAADKQDAIADDLKLGDALPAEDFLKIMLIESSNKAAFAFAETMGEQTFISLMNRKAEEIGMKSTFFVDPTGLSDGNYSTAQDLAWLAEYILKNYPKIFEITAIKETEVQGFRKIENTNQLLREIEGIVGGKTGFTLNAKGCLLVVLQNQKSKNYMIYVVLGSDDRFLEMKNIINWVNEAYQW